MPKKLNITEEHVVALYQELTSIKRVAEHLGCCQRTVVNYMNSAGVQRTHHSGPRPWVEAWNKLDLDEEKVIQVYKHERNLRKTSVQFECSTPTIRKILQKHNVPADGKATFSKKRRKQSSKTLKKLHAAGKLQGENHWNWQGGRHTVICCICGKRMKRYRDSRRPVCSGECNAKRASIDLSGEKSYMWRGDKSCESYSFGWRESLRKAIRERDEYKCRLCGKTQKQNGRRLSVHHIDYDKTSLDPENLVSLCLSCHSKTVSKRQHYQKLLGRKVG